MSDTSEAEARGVQQLLSVCRWGHRFYSEAAELSQRRRQAVTLQKLELQRAAMAADLQGWAEPTSWSGAALIPRVRSAQNDDRRILALCDRLDQATIAAYELELSNGHKGKLKALLQRHLKKLQSGMQLRATLIEDVS